MKQVLGQSVFLFLFVFFPVWTDLNAESEDVTIFKADKYVDLKMPEQALPVYMKLLESKPDDTLLINRVGYAWLCMGNHTNAGSWFSRAIGRDATNAIFWNNYGVSWHRMALWAKAENCYRHSLDLQPGNPRVLCNMAVVLFYQRKYAACIDSLLKALKNDKSYVQNRFDKKRCMDEISKMREKYPDDEELKRIQALFREKKF